MTYSESLRDVCNQSRVGWGEAPDSYMSPYQQPHVWQRQCVTKPGQKETHIYIILGRGVVGRKIEQGEVVGIRGTGG